MRDASGHMIGVFGVARDITERKYADENMRLATRVFDNCPEGGLITGASRSYFFLRHKNVRNTLNGLFIVGNALFNIKNA
jgi:hypothetical protein